MSEYITEVITKTRFVLVKIKYLENDNIPSIRIQQRIGENGVCNIDNVLQFFNKVKSENKEPPVPKSNRIQISVNSNDLSIRLLHPECDLWAYPEKLNYYVQTKDGNIKKESFIPAEGKLLMKYAGSTTPLKKKGVVYAYPNKIKISFQLKEMSGFFKNSIFEEKKEQKEISGLERKEEDKLSEISLDTAERIEKEKSETNTSIVDRSVY